MSRRYIDALEPPRREPARASLVALVLGAVAFSAWICWVLVLGR